MKYRIFSAVFLLLAVLSLPFLLRKDSGSVRTNTDDADTVVIISAHSEPMKHELEQGFRRYYREKYGRDVVIDWRAPGGTSDIVRYIADRRCVESKSLKLYLFAFRNHATFHEEAVNRILTDLVRLLSPRWMRVEGVFRPRGGIAISVAAEDGSMPELAPKTEKPISINI